MAIRVAFFTRYETETSAIKGFLHLYASRKNKDVTAEACTNVHECCLFKIVRMLRIVCCCSTTLSQSEGIGSFRPFALVSNHPAVGISFLVTCVGVWQRRARASGLSFFKRETTACVCLSHTTVIRALSFEHVEMLMPLHIV